MRISDLVSGAAVAALGFFLTRQGSELGLAEGNEPGSGFMIWWIGAAMMGAGALIGVLTVVMPALGQDTQPAGRVGLVALCVGLLIAYVVALEPVGFIPCSAVLLTILFAVVGGYRWHTSAGLGVSGSLASWLIFAKLLSSNLPAGLLAGTVLGS